MDRLTEEEIASDSPTSIQLEYNKQLNSVMFVTVRANSNNNNNYYYYLYNSILRIIIHSATTIAAKA